MTFLLRLWAYVTLGAIAFVAEEAAPLFGGVQAYDRNLHAIPVIFAVALGTWVVGVGLYGIGRAQSRSVRKRWPKLRPLVLQAAVIVRRHPWRASLGVRFAYGLRIPLPIACGVARVPMWLFFTASAVSCVVWSAMFTILGFWLAQTAEELVGEVRRYVPLIGALLVMVMILGAMISRRREVAEKTKRLLDRKPLHTPPTGSDAIQP